MKRRQTEADRLELDYLSRVETALAGQPDARGIVEDLRDHIEEAAAEMPGDEVSLVQMAQILERLGTPESVAPSRARPSPVDAAPLPPSNAPTVAGTGVGRSTAPRVDSDETVRFLDRLWIAYLIGVLGLYIPIIDLHFCELVSLALIAFTFGTWLRERPESYRGIRTLSWWCFGLYIVMCPLGILGLATPLASLFNMPVAIGSLVIGLVIYWKVMTGTAELVRDGGSPSVSGKILRTRQIYIIINAFIFFASIVTGVIIGLAGASRSDLIMANLIIPLIVLPIGWVVGYFFVLRPIRDARDALSSNRAS
jgi:hypothetical protein